MFNPNTVFASSWAFWGLLLIPLLAYWYYRKFRRNTSDVRFSTLDAFDGTKPSIRERLRHLPVVIRLLVLGVLIVALARPQLTSQGEDVHAEGIDIALLLDISGSMLAEDFQPNRIQAAKEVAQSFVEGRTNDRI